MNQSLHIVVVINKKKKTLLYQAKSYIQLWQIYFFIIIVYLTYDDSLSVFTQSKVPAIKSNKRLSFFEQQKKILTNRIILIDAVDEWFQSIYAANDLKHHQMKVFILSHCFRKLTYRVVKCCGTSNNNCKTKHLMYLMVLIIIYQYSRIF